MIREAPLPFLGVTAQREELGYGPSGSRVSGGGAAVGLLLPLFS